MSKVNLILDTDISNEVDDQFALVYLMKSLENFNLEAITIAPFNKSGYANTKSLDEGTNLSFNTARKILDMINMSEYKRILYKGATKYFFESKEPNESSQKIIEIARKNEHTTIIAIGAITNVALALYQAQDIIDKIDIVWLGGNSFLTNKNNEFNFRQDVEAVRYVFESKVKLVVIPCRNVASNLITTVYELEHYIGNCGKIGAYLCGIFQNCKKNFRKMPDDFVGESKTLWDLSAIAYVINKNWFKANEISCPDILVDTSYKFTTDKHKVTFVYDLNRHEIYKDFFIKMGYRVK